MTPLPTDMASWRAENMLTQGAAARALGIARTSVITYEHSRRELPLTVRRAMRDFETNQDEQP